MRLQDRKIRTLAPPEKGFRLVQDESVAGFAVRVTAAGSKAFVLDYRADGRRRRFTIGSWPEWSTTAAREEALQLRRKISQGGDPLAMKAARLSDPTFEDLAAEYLERHASKKKSGRRDREYLEREALPKWRRVKARAVSRADVLRLIEAKAAAAPIAANRLLACIRKVFNWGIERGIVESNPCYMVKAPGKERRRERVLTGDELKAVWTGMDEAGGVPDGVKGALRLVLATAQRPGEVAALEWSELDGEWWTIPAEKAKNQMAHRVPLSRMALQIIQAQQGRNGRHVFAAARGGGLGPNADALARAVRRCEGFGAANWTPHDLRRTAASMMTGAGVPRLVVGMILNHADREITAVYDRHSYDAEKRRALDAWGRRLSALIEGKPAAKVVEFIG